MRDKATPAEIDELIGGIRAGETVSVGHPLYHHSFTFVDGQFHEDWMYDPDTGEQVVTEEAVRKILADAERSYIDSALRQVRARTKT
jgi:hypothetical protein